jgi:hypothetical protein
MDLTLNQRIDIVPYPGFPEYKITLYEQSDEDLIEVGTIYRSYSNFTLNMFNNVELNKYYNLAVSIKIRGEFRDYGKLCDIGTITPVVTRIAKNEFSATNYPNPFSNHFNLLVKSDDIDSPISIKVYDLMGRIVENHTIAVHDIESYSFGMNLLSGIYNLILTQNKDTQTIRVVKR